MKVFVYIVIMLTIMTMLEITSIATDKAIYVPGIHNLLVSLQLVPGNVDISSGSMFEFLFGSLGILLLTTGASVVVGFALQSKLENMIILPFITGILVSFIQTFISLMTYSAISFPTWVSMLILIIFGPLTVGFIISCVEFFRGTD